MTAEHVLDSIWRASWQATILFAIVVLFVKLTPRLPSAIHCWGYRLVCLKLLLSLAVAPMLPIPVLPHESSTPAKTVAMNIEDDSAAVSDQENEWQLADASLAEGVVDAESKLPATSQARSANRSKATFDWFSWRSGLLLLWALGVVWQVCKLPRRLSELKRTLASAVNLDETETSRLLRREAIEMKMPHCPSLASVVSAECPAVVGLRQPVILLPQSILDEVSHTELRLLLRHELAHVFRRDLAWNWLATVTQWLFFFHPIVGITIREWRLHQESASDELALGTTPEDSAQYAKLLLNVAVSKTPSPLSPSAVGIFESFETLKRRIEKMAHFGTASQWRQKCVITAGAILAVVGLLPINFVPANSAMAATPADKAIKPENSMTVTGGLKVSVAGVADVSNQRTDVRSDFSKLKMTSDFNQDSGANTKSFHNGTSQGIASGSGFGAGGGGGGGSVTRFAGKPKLGIALAIEGKERNQRISFTNELIGVDLSGRTHKSLPTSGVTTMVVPSFEADHRDDVTTYFTGTIDRIKEFKLLKGQLLVQTVEVDQVKFQKLRTGVTQKTRLGEYRITKVQQGPSGIQVAVQSPIPKSLRSALAFQRMNPDAARKRFAAQRQLSGLTKVFFVDSKGNQYQPNSAGTHGSGQSFSTRQETTTANGTSVKVSGGSSSRKPGMQEKLYGLNQIPGGTEIVEVVVRVSDIPSTLKTVDFELKNVKLR